MYEVTVSATTEQKYLLDYVKDSLSLYIKQIDGISAEVQEKYRSYYTLACRDTYRHQLKRTLKESVARVLSLGCKNMFIRDLLAVGEGNFYQNVLINTMCVFDHKYDKIMMAHVVDAESDIYLDGYYNFRLGDFKQKWTDVTDMVLENKYILTDQQLILEFLRYLLQSVEHKVKRLTICFDDNDFYLFDSANKLMEKSLSLAPRSSVQEEAMVNAICLNPKLVKIYSKGELSQDFCDMAKGLFDVEFAQVQ